MSALKKQPNAIDIEVGARVRTIRMAKGMSQEKLGLALGITFQQIQKYEKGTNRMGSSRLQQIANVLGVKVVDFFPSADDNREASPLVELAQLSPLDLTIAKAASALSASQKRAVLRVINAIAGQDEDQDRQAEMPAIAPRQPVNGGEALHA